MRAVWIGILVGLGLQLPAKEEDRNKGEVDQGIHRVEDIHYTEAEQDTQSVDSEADDTEWGIQNLGLVGAAISFAGSGSWR